MTDAAKSVLLGLPEYGNALTLWAPAEGELPPAELMEASTHMLQHSYDETKKTVPLGPIEIIDRGWYKHYELVEIGEDDEGEPIWETDEDGEYVYVWNGRWDYLRGWHALTEISREL